MAGLRGRFLLLVVGIYVLVGALTVLGFFLETRTIVRQLVAGYATQAALQQRGSIEARVEREVVLAQKLADSPFLKSWSRAENDPERKRLALEDLESYRRLFADHSWFCAFEPARNFYFNNAANEFRGRELRYTLQPDNPANGWYFQTLNNVTDYALHVDHDVALNVTKLWINVPIRAGERRLGVCGGGLDLTTFLQTLVKGTEPGVQTVLLDHQGVVQAHPDEALMWATANQFDEARRPTLESLVDAPDRAGVKAALAALNGSREVESFAVRVQGRSLLAAATRMPDINWTVVVLVDPARAVHLHLFLPILALLAGSLLVAILLVSASLDRLILSRLARLTGWTRTLAQGRYDVPLTRDRNDEIGSLTESFGHMAATIRDYTHNLEERVEERTAELKAAQERLLEQNEHLLHLNQEKNLLLGMAAHDLRNPLSVILGYSEFLLLRRPETLTPQAIQVLGNIEEAAGFMLGLVESLLDVSALESGQLRLELETVDLGARVERLLRLNQPLAEDKRIQVLTAFPAEPVLVNVDPGKLDQVITNLLTNAVKYSYPDSQIEVRLAAQAADARLEVQDHGPGIPAPEQATLFQPFTRTSVRAPGGEDGTGLGLAIARRIVEGHGGQIGVTSQVGEGSTFWVSLPLASGA